MDIPYIIVAGGKGLRLGANIPKQYIEVKGKPIIYYTVSNLSKAGVGRFIIVIDWQYHSYLKEVLKEIEAEIQYVVCGKERYESVMNGLARLDIKDEYVGIHDSVRPLISKKMINDLENGILNENTSGVVPVLQVKDTIKVVMDDEVTRTLDRSSLRRIGTPQLVKVRDYLEAIKNIGERIRSTTDDASILEMNGNKVVTIEGEETAFKITDSIDLALFEVLVGRQNENWNRL